MKNIAVAISGASGSIYAKLLLDFFENYSKKEDFKLQLVYSSTAPMVWKEEIGDDSLEQFQQKFDYYANNDFYAPMASGSSDTEALVVIPCSMGILGRIAGGISNDLITRAGDVMLKERKKLILVPRETPYNLIHIQNMERLTQAGARIIPASPSFYSKPKDINQLCQTVVDRVLQALDIESNRYKWPEQVK